MLELAQEYGSDLLDFMKKYKKLQKKRFSSTYLLRKGHGVHRSSTTKGSKQFFFQI
jgi:hypothetical protein